jgi:hypothetical protein
MSSLSPKAAAFTTSAPQVQRDLRHLAPKFAAALAHGLNICWRTGLDPVVFEAVRSHELQRHYYAQGRTRPGAVITYAPSALYSWHGYGLAVDVVSASKAWGFSAEWIQRVATILKGVGLDWGGDWRRVDLPHFQWGTLKPSPSNRARELLDTGGIAAVWREVGAL